MKKAELKKLINQNPVNRGLDAAFVDGVMRTMVAKHYPEISEILKMQQVKYKRRIGEHNSTFIYAYRITGKTKNGAQLVKHLMYSSHSDHSRLHAYRVLTMLIEAGFNEGDAYKVIVPLTYLPQVKSLLYEQVHGRTLWEYMKKKTPPPKLHNVLNHIASWLRKLHYYPLSPTQIKTLLAFDPLRMYLEPGEVIAAVQKYGQSHAEKLRAFYDAWQQMEQQLRPQMTSGITYGDPHPENIIIEKLNADGLTMIDFTDVALGDMLRDCAIFIQQLQFMGRNYYTKAELDALLVYFIERYFQKSLGELSVPEFQRLNLYQAWNSLRSFVYLFHNDEQRERSYGLLEDAWQYLSLAQKKIPRLIIT